MRLRGASALPEGSSGGSEYSVYRHPRLTARVEGTEREPLAAMPTRRLPSPEANLNILQQRPADCVFSPQPRRLFTRSTGAARKGVRVYGLEPDERGQGLDLLQMLHLLREQEQCHYVLCDSVTITSRIVTLFQSW